MHYDDNGFDDDYLFEIAECNLASVILLNPEAIDPLKEAIIDNEDKTLFKDISFNSIQKREDIVLIRNNYESDKFQFPIYFQLISDKSIPPILILLDMNGTLLIRHPSKILDFPPDLFFNDRYYYIRPHVKYFLQWLNDIHFVKLAFYTSMQYKNANAALSSLVGNNSQIFLYAQEYNKSDPHGDKPWSMLRDLPKIWNCKDTPAYNHNHYNTLMIDDSISKMREYPDNVLVIPEYSVEMVTYENDKTIQQLTSCIEDIF
jgi:hypothetical protein